MKIKSISIKNFRSYMNETTISFDNLTAFIGKTLQTYIRNYFHHPENDKNARYTYSELKMSIEKMIEIAESI